MNTQRVVAGRYRLEERIGSGAMGVVWRGTDERLGRVVAVKQVFLHGGLDEREAEEVRQRTMREGRIAARLQHAHAISVFDASIDDDEPWLVMEYLPSRSLAAVLGDHGPIDPRQVARMGRQVADALDAAHQAGIVHRDVKPGNVLIGADGTVKITDFGISRATGDLTLTRTGVLAGTPAYLAPEVARGEDSTAASDVFSLGATLYAAVEGVPPFGSDDNALALLHTVAAGQVPPPMRAGPLTALLMRLLRDDPAERPTAARARAELGRIAHSGPTTGREGATAEFPGPLDGGDTGGDAGGVDVGGDGSSTPRPRTRRGLPVVGAPGSDASHRSSPKPARAARPAEAPGPPRRPSRFVVAAVLVTALLAGGGLGYGLLGSSSVPGQGASVGQGSQAAADPQEQMVSAVREYYDVVTDNSAAGWARLGPTLQGEAGGFSAYQSFWSTIDSARVTEATAVDDTTVRATVEFDPSGRSRSEEVHEFGMIEGPDGGWLIDSDERVD